MPMTCGRRSGKAVTRAALRGAVLMTGMLGTIGWSVTDGLLMTLALVLTSPAADAQAPSCTSINASVTQTYTGAALSRSVTRNVTCSNLPSNSYTLCINGAANPGTGGNTTTPYRKLDDGSGNKANWQIYTSSGQEIVSPQTVVGSANANQLANGVPVSLELRFPVQSVGYGTFSTQINGFNVNVKAASDCSGTSIVAADYTLSYTVSVPASCSALTTGSLDFGNISSLASNVPASSQISLTCTANSPYTVYLGSGLNASGGSNRMRNGTNYLTYSLFSNPLRTVAWTDSQGVSGTGTGSSQTMNVFGRVPAQPIPPVGSYTDTVVVTLSY